jgi:hypothetical protein
MNRKIINSLIFFVTLAAIFIFSNKSANEITPVNAAENVYNYNEHWEIHSSSIGIYQPEIESHKIGTTYLFKHNSLPVQLYSPNSDWETPFETYLDLLPKINSDIMPGLYRIDIEDNNQFKITHEDSNNSYLL